MKSDIFHLSFMLSTRLTTECAKCTAVLHNVEQVFPDSRVINNTDLVFNYEYGISTTGPFASCVSYTVLHSLDDRQLLADGTETGNQGHDEKKRLLRTS